MKTATDFQADAPAQGLPKTNCWTSNARLFSYVVLPWLLCHAAAAQDHKKPDVKILISEATTPVQPYWYTAKRAEVCYGIEVRTEDNVTEDAPWLVLHGTKASSKPHLLDNGAENFETVVGSPQIGHADYFLYSADLIGDIGIPTMIELTASGGDGWKFNDVRVDYFAAEGWNMNEWTKKRQDLNDRDRVLKDAGSALQTTIKFPGIGAIDDEEEVSEGIRYKKVECLKAEGSSLTGGSNSEPISVNVSSEYIMVDARHSSSDILWDSSAEERVSSEDIVRALQIHESENSSENKVTVGVKVKSEVNTGVSKNSAEFSLQNEFSVRNSSRTQSEDENTNNINKSFGSQNTKKFTVTRGDVAFFQLGKTATVSTYSDFALLRRVNPSVSVTYDLVPTYFRTDMATGELRLLNVSFETADAPPKFEFGDCLSDPTQASFLAAAKRAWPNFSTKKETR